MLTEKTNAVQSKAVEHEDQTLQDHFQAIQTERLVLIKHYQSLYKQHQALLERYPTSQGPYLEFATFRQTLQDYRQFQQEHRRLNSDVREALMSASRATLDRLLRPARVEHRRRATTRRCRSELCACRCARTPPRSRRRPTPTRSAVSLRARCECARPRPRA